MATRTGLTTYPEERAVQVQWSGLLNTDDGAVATVGHWPMKSVQAAGTFGVGGSVAMEGSNNNVDWAALRDNMGVVIALTAANILREIGENARYIRPRVTAGDGTTTLVVTMFGA